MNPHKKLFLGAAITALAASTANVANASDIKPYIGLDYSLVNVSYEASSGAASDEFWAETGHGLNPYVGIKVHENIGLELGYLATADAGKTTSTTSTDVNVSGFHLDAVGNYQINEKFDLIGTVGFARLKAEAKVKVGAISAVADDTDTAWRIGAGASYDLNETTAIRSILRYNFIDWEDSANGFMQANVGLQYRF